MISFFFKLNSQKRCFSRDINTWYSPDSISHGSTLCRKVYKSTQLSSRGPSPPVGSTCPTQLKGIKTGLDAQCQRRSLREIATELRKFCIRHSGGLLLPLGCPTLKRPYVSFWLCGKSMLKQGFPPTFKMY